ncbi:MAG: hypothetical protein Tsb0013_19600 [Phycisphaerales bacterium]
MSLNASPTAIEPIPSPASAFEGVRPGNITIAASSSQQPDTDHHEPRDQQTQRITHPRTPKHPLRHQPRDPRQQTRQRQHHHARNDQRQVVQEIGVDLHQRFTQRLFRQRIATRGRGARPARAPRVGLCAPISEHACTA